MKTALIGYTGFVGGNILKQKSFTDMYNSSNVTDINGKTYDLLVCAGAPGIKWKANKEPQADFESIQKLKQNLSVVQAAYVVLISTIDVYDTPFNVDETSQIKPENQHVYGKHRLQLEEFVSKQFPKSTIIRLPGLFGKGIKKNFIYDLIHDKNLELTHNESKFQFYNLDNLWKDIQKIIDQDIKLVNFATPPVSAKEVAMLGGKENYSTITTSRPVYYDVKTINAPLFGQVTEYMYSKENVLAELKNFIEKGKSEL